MIDVKISYRQLPYIRPVPVRGKTLTENDYLIVTISDQDFYISTLPGLHQATLPEIAYKLKFFFENYKLDFKEIDFGKKFFNLVLIDSFLETITAETLFNLEVILLQIIFKNHPALNSKLPIKVNQLYSPIKSLSDYQHCACLKIKIDPKNHDHIVGLINDLHQQNPETVFRLDGNRQYELAELIKLHNLLENELSAEAFLKIDYLEEPLKIFYESYDFTQRFKLKIAIDESFTSMIPAINLPFPAVIKPSLFGLSPIYAWLRSRQDCRAIISSSYEHPTIISGLYFLAEERPLEFHGLENVHSHL